MVVNQNVKVRNLERGVDTLYFQNKDHAMFLYL